MAQDFVPDSDFKPDSVASAQTPANSPGFIPDDKFQSDDEKYGSLPQQALAGIEGAAKGVAGPLAPALEQATGLTTGADIRARAETNPVTHGLSEATGFVGSMFAPEVKGLTSLGSVVGNIGEHAASLLPEATSTISKIAATGVKTGAEMAALAGSDELSKMVTGDPNQTLGTAAINVGLSGILGGIGGITLGAVSPLWKKASNVIGAEKVASDYMGETKFINENPDMLTGAAQEVMGRMAEADQILNGGLKGQAIAQTLPEATPDNLAKIDTHLQEVASEGAKRIEDAGKNSYLKNKVPLLTQDLSDFESAITDPNSSVQSKWDALDDYKRASQAHADYNVITGGAEEKAVSKWIKPFNVMLREAAENPKVWGEAGNVQKTVNKAAAELFQAQKDFLPKVTGKELGERVADPTKIQTILNQAGTGKGALRQNAVKNYLEATQNAADAINAAHVDNGLEAPLASKLNPTPVLDHALGTPVTPGVELARWANKNGSRLLGNAVGESAAGVAGGGLGALVGHPLVGAWMGERVLGPIFSAIAKPLAETAINAEAARASVDYVGNVVKGQKTLSDTIGKFFKPGGEVLSKDLIPDEESRQKLQKSLDHLKKPENALKVAGSLGHYLPDHAQVAAATAATASNYLNSLKPNPQPASPLDKVPPISRDQQNKYNRALDIAQQPLLVLKHAKEGTLLPQDVQSLQTIYPGLHSAIVNKLTESMIDNKAEGRPIPYAQRTSLSLLMGTPLDSTQMPQSMQAVIVSQGTQQMAQQMGNKSQHKASGVELKQINKVAQMYQTPLQARELEKRS